MNSAEIERLITAFDADPAMAKAYRSLTRPEDLAARLKADGFSLTVQDMLEAGRTALSDAALDRVVGGKRPEPDWQRWQGPQVDIDAWRQEVARRFPRRSASGA